MISLAVVAEGALGPILHVYIPCSKLQRGLTDCQNTRKGDCFQITATNKAYITLKHVIFTQGSDINWSMFWQSKLDFSAGCLLFYRIFLFRITLNTQQNDVHSAFKLNLLSTVCINSIKIYSYSDSWMFFFICSTLQ